MTRKREVLLEPKRKSRKISISSSFNSQMINYKDHCIERNLTDNTVQSYIFYLSYLRKYLISQNHSLLVDEILEKDLKGFLSFMRKEKDNTQATLNSAIASIRPFFNYLENEQVIAVNPMEKIRKGKVDKNPIIPFSESDILKLLKQPDKSRHAGYRDYCIMLILASTGMRISECLNLRICDIDFSNERIVISQTKNRRPRIVGLASKIKLELQRFIRICLHGTSSTDYLFQNQDSGQVSSKTIQDNTKRYGQGAKIDPQKRVSPHTFRHTYAISYLKNGGSTASLREQLGHLTIETVEKYLYWSNEDKLEEFKKYNPVDNMNL